MVWGHSKKKYLYQKKRIENRIEKRIEPSICKVFNAPIVLIVLKTLSDWLVLELSIRFGSFDPKMKLRYLAANFFSEIHSIYFKLSAQSYYFVQN